MVFTSLNPEKIIANRNLKMETMSFPMALIISWKVGFIIFVFLIFIIFELFNVVKPHF